MNLPNGNRVVAVTPYGRGAGSARVRVFTWLDLVTDTQFTVSCYLARRDARPVQLARRPAAVAGAELRLRRLAQTRPRRLLLHREASPLSRGGLEQRLLRGAEFAVYDFDDALQWDTGDGSPLRRLAPKAPKASAAVRCADRVVAGSPALAEWAAAHHRDVRLIPSCVEPGDYRRKADYALHDPPRLGWLGSAGNEPCLQRIAPALSEVHRRTGARLTLIGTARPCLGPLEAMIDRVAWSEEAQDALLAELDLGLMPVPDTPYNRGKCGYKLLQYAAAGLPATADPVGVNALLLRQFGLPAPRRTEEWTDVLLGLLAAPASERARMGEQARRAVAEEYSYRRWLPAWRAALELDSLPLTGDPDARPVELHGGAR